MRRGKGTPRTTSRKSEARRTRRRRRPSKRPTASAVASRDQAAAATQWGAQGCSKWSWPRKPPGDGGRPGPTGAMNDNAHTAGRGAAADKPAAVEGLPSMNAPPPPLNINDPRLRQFLGVRSRPGSADWTPPPWTCSTPTWPSNGDLGRSRRSCWSRGGGRAPAAESLIPGGVGPPSTSLTNRLIRALVTPGDLGPRGVMKDVAIRSTAAALGLRGRAKLRKQEAQAPGRRADDATGMFLSLDSWIRSGKRGVQGLGEGALFRARYMRDGRGGRPEMLARGAELDGAQLVKRILGVADHCKPCLRLAAKGFIPIADLTPIGNTPCRVFCHCRLIFRPPWTPNAGKA